MIHSVFLCPLNDTILQFGIIQDFFLLRNDRVQLVSSYSKNPLFSRISGVSTPNNVSPGCVYFLFVCHKNCHNKKPLTIKGSGSDYYITFSSFFNSFCTLALLHPSPPLISIQRLLHLKSLIAQKTLLQHPDLQPHCLSNRYSQSASLLAHNRITS